MGKKTMDIKTQCDALRGRKSKAGGGKKSKATQEYTPLISTKHVVNCTCNSHVWRQPLVGSFYDIILWFFLRHVSPCSQLIKENCQNESSGLITQRKTYTSSKNHARQTRSHKIMQEWYGQVCQLLDKKLYKRVCPWQSISRKALPNPLLIGRRRKQREKK